MKQLQTKNVRQGINKAYLKVDVNRADLDAFKKEAVSYLNNLEQAEGKDEEHHKAYLRDFLKDSFYSKEDRLVNTSKNVDLGIYSGKTTSSTLEVIIEAKKPDNTREMITKEKPNAKALHEALLYYFEEREAGNEDLKHLVVTNYRKFFFFDAQEIERVFYAKGSLKKTYRDWNSDQKVSGNTDFMYGKFEAFIKDSDATLHPVYIHLDDFAKQLQAPASDQGDKPLIPLYKLFSPEHLVKKAFANDSNSLDKPFYNELLHIIGLKDVRENGSRLIKRLPEKERSRGSIIENTLEILRFDQHMNEVREAETQYGEQEDDQLFGVALELVITWINRVLFLKLLEAQLLAYHQNDPKFRFLVFKDSIDEYDELNKLFFRVLALRNEDRPESVQERFGHIPYLNSSLFDATKLETSTIHISALDDKAALEVHPRSILKKGADPPAGPLNTLDYLLRFLDAYNFSAESSGGIQTEDKTLINASVLGLIFEKINGYKDGSFFTPGFITEYMARETLRKSVTDKLNDAFGWDCKDFSELPRKIETEDLNNVNAVVNSLTICDPAVGSGHFLVSCLNELIAIKSELRILCDHEGKRIPYLDIEVENDELAIEHEGELFEYKLNHEWANGKVSRKPAGKERQRIQEALFHEKKFLIENCLFGVDINPNSVKICRLRLWIELLKHAYYRSHEDYSELEVLPNIDINIKEGNSLVSRFGLDEDLTFIFKKSEHSLEDYKKAVRSYRESRDRNEKQRLQNLIDDIKKEYRQNLINNLPIYEDISKAKAKLNAMVNQIDAFGKTVSDDEIAEQRKKVEKLEEQRAEKEAGAFYREAFEWRFEFPEVLDEEGKYIGFDVVIGNPPYIFGRDWKRLGLPESLKDYYNSKFDLASYQIDLYILFIERSFQLTKNIGLISLIVPNTWLNNTYANVVRKYILENSPEINLIETPPNTFADVNVDTILFVISKSDIRHSNQLHLKGINNEQQLNYSFSHDKKYYSSGDTPISMKVSEEQANLLRKIKETGTNLENICDATRGIHPYRTGGYGKSAFLEGPQIEKDVKERPYNSDKKIKDYRPFIYGKNLERFSKVNADEYIRYGDWLAEPRNPKFFEGERVFSRKILGDRLIVTYVDDNTVADQQIYITKPKDLKTDSKYLAGLLGSKLISFFIRYYFDEREDLFPQIKVSQLKSLPVLNTKNDLTNQISELIGKALKKENPEADTSELEAEIDRLVYELYGLSEEEIGVVEGSGS